VYHISSIDDISLVPQKRHGEDPNEFIIKYDKGKSSMTLSTAKRDAIVSVLRHNKQRYEISKPTNISERIIRPNDVPGRLLNMALLNIGSEDPNLRLAAYNLLYALSLTFRFDVGNQLLDAKGKNREENGKAFGWFLITCYTNQLFDGRSLYPS
jgi:neurofibromin 1